MIKFLLATLIGISAQAATDRSPDPAVTLRLKEPSPGANIVTLKTNPSFSADYNFVFPATAGTLGQVLTATDSSGNYSWSTPQPPFVFSSPLALSGTTASLNYLAPLTTTAGSLSIPAATNSVNGYLTAADHTSFNNKANTDLSNLAGTTAVNSSLRMGTNTILNAGSLAIGSSTPGAYLDIKGDNISFAGQLRLQASDFAQITFYDSNAATVGGANMKAQIYYNMSEGDFLINNYSNGSYGDLVLNADGGNVGVGTSSPATKLDVFGAVKMTGFYMPTGAGSGYVLTSDGSGIGTWVLPATPATPAIYGSGAILTNPNPITGAGTLSMGTLGIANGGTNRTTVAASGNFLISDGTNYIDGTIAAGSNVTVTRVAGTITIAATGAAGTTPPTQQRFTSGSGTYTTPASVVYLKVRMVGGGGGGGGQNAAGTSNGGNTTFGTIGTATGGVKAGAATGGAGGTATITLPAYGFSFPGGAGENDMVDTGALGVTLRGGDGGMTPFGGGATLVANTGAGGKGVTASDATGNSGAGGGAGAYIEMYVPTPSGTYSYAVGAAGSGGGGGGNGAAGIIIVDEYY